MRLPVEMRALPLWNLGKHMHAQWRGSTAQSGWRWWIGQLRGCLPGQWRQDTPEQCYRWPISGSPPERIAQQRAVLLLRPDQVLQHSLLLPLTAGRDLDRLVSYELDRFTPFGAGDVHYVIRREGVAASRLRLTLVLVRRDCMAQWVADYAAHALSFDRVDVMDEQGAPQGLNLLPGESNLATRRSVWRVGAWLLPVLLVTSGTLMTWTLQRQQAAVEQRMAEVKALRVQVSQMQSLRQSLAQTGSTARQLSLLKQGRVTNARLLAQLSTCLPADSWLQSLQITKEGQVDLAGFSTHASALINQMKGCPDLVEVRYQGIIQPDLASGKDRFYMRAQLRREPDHAVYADSP